MLIKHYDQIGSILIPILLGNVYRMKLGVALECNKCDHATQIHINNKKYFYEIVYAAPKDTNLEIAFLKFYHL